MSLFLAALAMVTIGGTVLVAAACEITYRRRRHVLRRSLPKEYRW